MIEEVRHTSPDSVVSPEDWVMLIKNDKVKKKHIRGWIVHNKVSDMNFHVILTLK